MIKEAYVSFEVAKLLKDKGFKEACHAMYNRNECLIPINFPRVTKSEKREFVLDAPTHQMAMKWLREEKNISIVVDDDKIPLSYKYIIKKYSINDKSGVLILKLDSLPFIKYEIAVEAAIKYSLENLI